MASHSSPLTADYVVVGAGTAGCAVARRLAEDPQCRVVLLEAGGHDRHPFVRMPVAFLQTLRNPAFNWNYHSEPEARLGGRRLPVPRGKLLGGSSSINGLFHIRGHARDFDEWRDLGNDGWGYADVLPYFKRSERNWRGAGPYHGDAGPVSVRAIDTARLLHEPLKAAAVNAGHSYLPDYDVPHDDGFAKGEVAVDDRGRRCSSARAYLRDLPANLTVLSRAQVRRIVIEGTRAVAVECRRGGVPLTVRAEREIVLSAGTYNSPHLLMLSGVGPANELRKCGIRPVLDLPGVGQNLIEHPRVPLRFDAAKPVTFATQLRLDRAAVSFLNWAVFGKGPFATQICSGTFLLRTDPGLDRPDIQLLCNPIGFDARVWVPGLLPARPHCFYVTVCLLHQRSRGQVSLASADPADAPRISFNLLSDPADVVTLREGVRAARRIYRTEPQASLTAAETVPGDHLNSDTELDDAIRALVGITHHPVGTCRMGQDGMAVVAPDLRVRGIDGLRIADASVMPTIPGANTNAATLMIGEKAADLILGRALPPEYPDHVRQESPS